MGFDKTEVPMTVYISRISKKRDARAQKRNARAQPKWADTPQLPSVTAQKEKNHKQNGLNPDLL